MRIANQPFMAQPTRSTKAVKSHEKTQTDKVTGTSEMSQAEEMEAFKKDFYNELSQITTHNTVSNMAVNVSEKAFEAMKTDPVYKEKVLSLIKRDCQSSYGSRNASLLISVGASLEEYRGDSWPVGYDAELKAVIVDEDFLAQVKDFREQQPKLEVSWDRVVDPDGRIAAKAYVESLVTQYQKAQTTIKEYYSGAHRDNLSQPSQSEGERNMSFEQERALLLGGNLTMKDPYALASSGGLLNIEDADKNANQVVRDKLDELISQWKQANADKFEK